MTPPLQNKESRITGMGLLPLTLPMRQPFITAAGEKAFTRNLLVAVRLGDGTVGAGEASSSLAWAKDSPEAMTNVLVTMHRHLLGADIRSWRRLIDRVWEMAGTHPTAAAALECALLDALTRHRRIPLWQWLGGRRRSVTTDLTVSAWPVHETARFTERAYRLGFRKFKVKVTGQDIDQDIRRVACVHKSAPQATLVVDANQGFTTRQAIRFCLLLLKKKLPVHLVEQPVSRENLEGLQEVQRKGGIPVAADESARALSETSRLIRSRAISVINVKLAKSGLLGALAILRLAQKHRIKLMIGCMAESAFGLSASVALACGSGAFEFVDLDSHLLVASPQGVAGFSSHGPRLSIYPTRHGSGARYPFCL